MNGLRYITVNEVIEELQKMTKADPNIGDAPDYTCRDSISNIIYCQREVVERCWFKSNNLQKGLSFSC